MSLLNKKLLVLGLIAMMVLSYILGAHNSKAKLPPGSWIATDAEAQLFMEKAYFNAQVDASRDLWRVKYLPEEDRWQWTSSPWSSGLLPRYQPQNSDFKLASGK